MSGQPRDGGSRAAGKPSMRMPRSTPALLRQLLTRDQLGMGEAARSPRPSAWSRARARPTGWRSRSARTAPSAAARSVYVKDEKVIQIEGDPDSPISRGRLCPKGSASRQLHEHPAREYKVKYRRPHGTEWEELDLDTAMDMIADRLIKPRAETWEDVDEDGHRSTARSASRMLGGATLDNEENYLIKKFFSAMGALQIENQARI